MFSLRKLAAYRNASVPSSSPACLAGRTALLSFPVDVPLVSDLAIREYEPADADAVWNLHERALRDAGAFDEEFTHLDDDLRAITDEYLHSDGAFLVGERDGRLVAMGAVQPSDAVDHHHSDPNTGVLRRMRFDPAHQRRGYGSQILTALERRARELGFDRLVLDTTPRQTAAIALYESFDYAEQRRESTPAGEQIIYAKPL